MKNYYEPGDQVMISLPNFLIDTALEIYGYKDKAGREKIALDLSYSQGTVTGVVEGRGHIDVLYKPDGKDYTWKIPTTIISPLNNVKQ